MFVLMPEPVAETLKTVIFLFTSIMSIAFKTA